MDLIKNKYITKAIAKLLIEDNWTMAKLATSSPRTLRKHKGIGAVLAAKIVKEAGRLVNQQRFNEAALHQPPEQEITNDDLSMSVRVRRIRETNQ